MPGSIFRPLRQSLTTLSSIARDLVHLLVLVSRSRRALAAENLFLRKQLALFQERKVKPHRADDSTRLIMVILGRLFAWRDALVNVKPDTFIPWHRKGFRLLWRWKSRPVGRPRIPKDLRRLIQEMAAENPTWGEERIANELNLKLTIQISPRTVGKYLRRQRPVRSPDPKQRWLTFVRNHAKVMVACDCFVGIQSIPPWGAPCRCGGESGASLARIASASPSQGLPRNSSFSRMASASAPSSMPSFDVRCQR